MGLLSIFQRSNDAAAEAPAPAAPDAVAAARTRARRRLIGAAVLLGIGVIGFPLLFETQPRPIPVNIPIEIPRKDGAPPLAPPVGRPPLAAASAAVVLPDAETSPAPAPAEIVERAADAGREVASAASAAAKPAPAPSRPSAARQAEDRARVQALLDGKPAGPTSVGAPADKPASAAGRVVVQVGAYTEPAKLQEARQKLEKMGFKTYTQVVEVDGAKRTRVRVGPFDGKAEAEKAAARIKASGLPVAILSL